MPCKHPRIVLLATLLIAIAILAMGCEVPTVAPAPVAEAPTVMLSPTTAAPESAEAEAPTVAPQTVAPPVAADPTPTPTPEAEPTPAPTETPVVLGDLGLSAGAAQLAAALGVAEPGSLLRFESATLAGGRPALVGASPDGHMIVEIIGPAESPVTASFAMLLPEGDAAARETARAGLYQLIGVAMPEREWALAWLDERIEDALAGTPYSVTHGDYYAQVVRLTSPQPYISIAVTLAPQTLALPTWGHLGAAAPATVDTGWERLPIMPDPLRGQHMPTDRFELYEYTVNAAIEAVEGFYEREMAAEGWALADRASVADPGVADQRQIVLIYRRGTEGALVTIDRYSALEETLVTLGYAEDAADLPTIAG
jgi:hypothetical protein